MLTEHLQSNQKIFIFQRKEMAELFSFETRNKYSIELENGRLIGFAVEEGKSLGHFFWRQILGHWRSFSIRILDSEKQTVLMAVHPFRFFFERLEVLRGDGKKIGIVQRRFNPFFKRFDILDEQGNLLLEVAGPLWKPWTFPFFKNGDEVAKVFKKWSGLFKEAFTDSDNFTIEFNNSLTIKDRELILAATFLIDIVFFEKKASR